jgi:hypothetical protein
MYWGNALAAAQPLLEKDKASMYINFELILEKEGYWSDPSLL